MGKVGVVVRIERLKVVVDGRKRGEGKALFKDALGLFPLLPTWTIRCGRCDTV